MAEEEPTTISNQDEAPAPSPVDPALEETIASDPSARQAPAPTSLRSPHSESEDPKTVGRYVIRRRIGRGAFGDVFLAHDESLRRSVALKVINRGPIDDTKENLLEGRTLAQLDHPGIVAVHDVGEVDGRLYFVSKYIEGKTLGQHMADQKLSPEEAAGLIAEVAESLSYAHARSVIHRDIKPNNIIVTPDYRPVLIDFGIALGGQGVRHGHYRAIMGTPSHMSPEQARGESHLVDGRTDIYSLGVILYEMLTGLRPFEARTEDLLDQVASPTLEARPPRQIDARIPKAIERICLKALAKRTADRYSTAQDFADDLNSFVASWEKRNSNDTRSFHAASVIPKGLRSFDENDAEFFLQLLPGLRDQAGIPDGLRFWQRGILNRIDPFRVGVLYGPSGSGKSSFLKAGLIPLLPDEIEVIYASADAIRLEENLKDRLRDLFPEVGKGETLNESIRRIREEKLVTGKGKVLIVIDQFEQWLHGRAPNSDLVSALRQCDGKTVQVILSLRDDFWMAIGQLMEDIDVDLLQSKNAAAIDLFEKPHAWRVLIEFGRAYERFPSGEEALTDDQAAFIRAALSDLEQDGKIIPLQLALFAEIAKGVDWTRESYEKIGGARAIGTEFLNSVFTSRSANPAHRAVEKEARAILEALLPEGGEMIRGRALTEKELIEKAGLFSGPSRFANTMAILDGELKLVTPADSGEGNPEAGERRYQLTHDFLVPSLRDWLYENRRSTLRGKSYLRLKELSSAWKGTRDRRHLPGFFEWAGIRILVPKHQWGPDDETLMSLCGRRNGIKMGLFACLLIVLGAGVGYVNERARVHGKADRFLAAGLTNPATLKQTVAASNPALKKTIDERLASGELTEAEDLKARLFLLSAGDTQQADPLFEKLSGVPLEESETLIDSLVPFKERYVLETWRRVEDSTPTSTEKLRLATYLARCDPENSRWRDLDNDPVRWLLTAPQREIALWAKQLRPLKPLMLPDLRKRITEASQIRTAAILDQKAVIAALELINENIDDLLPLLDEVPETSIDLVAARFGDLGEPAIATLERHLQNPKKQSGDSPNDLRRRRARAGAALVRLEKGDSVWPWFTAEKDPGVRARLIHLIPASGADPQTVFGRLEVDSDIIAQIGLIQTLGEYDPGMLSPQFRTKALAWLQNAHQFVPDPGVHFSIEWVIDRWGEIIPESHTIGAASINRPWIVNSMGQEFAVIEIEKAPETNLYFAPRFALSVTETTSEHADSLGIASNRKSDPASTSNSPIVGINMIRAMQYCNALSRKEGFPKEEWCYLEKIENGQPILKPAPNFLQRHGYRLPTETEWIHVASQDFGERDLIETLDQSTLRYAWVSQSTTPSPVGLLRPNRFGLFDIFGNALEWCHAPPFSSVVCGGSTRSAIEDAGAGDRSKLGPETHLGSSGFRVARTLP